MFIQRLRQFFLPPSYGDEETARIARIFHLLILVTTAVLDLWLVVELVSQVDQWNPTTITIVLALIVFSLLLLQLNHKGYVNLGSGLLVASFWCSNTTLAYVNDGVHGAGLIIYAAIMALTCLLLNWRMIILVTLLSIIAIWGMVYAEQQAWIFPRQDSAPATATEATAIFILIAVFLGTANASLSRALARAQMSEQSWRQSNAVLQNHIDQLAQRESALEASEARFRTLADTTAAMIVIYDQERLYYANPSAAQLTGYSQEELLRKNFYEIVHPASRQLIAERAQARMRGDPVNDEMELRIVTRDEVERWIAIRGSQTTFQGRLVGMGTAFDITARKQAEAEREALIQKLEAQNAELERFAYTVSHDLRSPLITIGSFLGFLERDALTGDQARFEKDLRQIREAVERMGGLLDDVLELSRVGRLMNPPEAVPFAEIVREALEMVQGRLQERQISVAIADDLPVVYGDRLRLVEAVQNLVDNAAKFMGEQPAPHIQIGVRTQAEDCPPTFFVQDNGIGIAPDYQQKIFGLFEKLDRKSEGSGIGLALVKRIIEVHGGRIWIESAGPGHGATFCFTLA